MATQEKVRQFESAVDWQDFCSYLRGKHRYVLSAKWQQFIETILSGSRKRVHVLKKGSNLYRARNDDSEDIHKSSRYLNALSAREMGAPPASHAKAGRINPQGIPCLYLATNIKTAIYEIRPWLGSLVSVGKFEIVRNQRLVDLTKNTKKDYSFAHALGQKLTSEQIEMTVWAAINNSFARPISPGQETLSYVPTQYLAEVFKMHGFDGIGYKSSLSRGGYNVALFDPSSANIRAGLVFEIKGVSYNFKQAGNPCGYDSEGKRRIQIIEILGPARLQKRVPGTAGQASIQNR